MARTPIALSTFTSQGWLALKLYPSIPFKKVSAEAGPGEGWKGSSDPTSDIFRLSKRPLL